MPKAFMHRDVEPAIATIVQISAKLYNLCMRL